MITLKSSWTVKVAFVAFLQMAGVKRRHLPSRNVMRSIRYTVQNKGITLNIFSLINIVKVPLNFACPFIFRFCK